MGIKRKMPKAILITNILSPNRLRYISVQMGTLSVGKRVVADNEGVRNFSACSGRVTGDDGIKRKEITETK